KNGDSLIEIGPSLTVKASDFNHVLNITVEAYVNEELVASTQISFTDTEDGEKGDDGKSSWTAWANSEDGKVDFSITESKNRRFIGTYTGIEQSTNYLDYKWTDMVGTVVVGTNNLIDGTKSFVGTDWFTSATLEDENLSNYPFTLKKWTSGQKVSHTKDIMVEQGVTYTFSAYIKREQAGNLYFYLYDETDGFITSDTQRETIIKNVDSSLRRFEITFTPAKTGKIRPRFAMVSSEQGSFSSGGFMLVRGNKTGDWQESEADKASNLDSKADGAFTVEQLNALAERARIAETELQAKATLETVNEWVQALQDEIKARQAGQKISEQKLIEASNRMVAVQQNIGEMQIRTDFVNKFMSQSEDGLVIGQKDGTSSVRVDNDRISFYSSGKEVAYIAQSVLVIDSGIFTTKLQIGRYRIEQYELNADINVVRYVG
ncbi:TPA: N-acetylmuramoyl-L-alanine amidase, partial [Streptococcus agalactiae]